MLIPIATGVAVVGISIGVSLLRRRTQRQRLGDVPADGAEEDEPVCAICLEPPVQMAKTQCNHCYCLPCFKSWEEKQVQRRSEKDFFASAIRCPLCMEAVTRLSTADQTFVQPTTAQRQQADDEMRQRLWDGLIKFAGENLQGGFVAKERSAENDARRTALSPAANNVVLRAPLEPLPCGARVVISERGVRKMVMTIRRLIHGEGEHRGGRRSDAPHLSQVPRLRAAAEGSELLAGACESERHVSCLSGLYPLSMYTEHFLLRYSHSHAALASRLVYTLVSQTLTATCFFSSIRISIRRASFALSSLLGRVRPVSGLVE